MANIYQDVRGNRTKCQPLAREITVQYVLNET